MYSTAPKPRLDKLEHGIKDTPIQGLGFGLPIARLYTKYFPWKSCFSIC